MAKKRRGKWGCGETKGEHPERAIKRKANTVNRSSRVQSHRILACAYLGDAGDNHTAVSE